MINIIKDEDLINHVKEYDVTLVGTNTYCFMQNGFPHKVILDYPYVYNINLATKYGDIRKMGTLVECKEEGEPTFCLCYIATGGMHRPDVKKDFLSYESLESCLKLINVRYKGLKVATTLLGTSRFDGNGDRERVMKIFNDCIKDLDVDIYDYHQNSRAEDLKERYLKELSLKKVNPKEYREVVKKRKELEEERFKKNGHIRN